MCYHKEKQLKELKMKKILENFKKMPLLFKIATIAFIAALLILLFATLAEYIGDIFFFGLFQAMFANVYGFFAVIVYFLQTLLQIVFVAALVIAMFTKNKGNVSFVLLCKAIIISISMFLVSPFTRVTLVISYGFRASIISGSVIFNGLISLLYMLGLISLAILILKGYGKFTKLAGFITGGVFLIIDIVYFVEMISAIVDSVKDFLSGRIASGIFGLLGGVVSDCASIILVAGFVVMCLSAALSAKGLPKQEQKEEE